MSRCAIPWLTAAFFLSTPILAAPVPPAPKADDSVSPTATKLLEHRKVQKELKMTAEQRIVIFDGLAEIEEDFEKKLTELSRNPNAPEVAFDKLDRERLKSIDKLLADSAKKLTDAQRTRLRQLDWRVRGVAAFADPKVEKLLQLTEAQKKKVAELTERMKDQTNRFLDGQIDGDITKQQADLFAFRKDLMKQMETALTAEQKTAWERMLGDAITGFVVEEVWLRMIEDEDLNPLPVPPP